MPYKYFLYGGIVIGVTSPITWLITGSAVDAVAVMGMAIFILIIWLGQLIIDGVEELGHITARTSSHQ